MRKKNMERTIKISTLNKGEAFEIPKRKVEHTRYVLQKTTNVSEGLVGYETGYHSAYIVLKSVFPKLDYKDIDQLEDETLTKLNNIIWGNPEKYICPKCKYEFKREDFRKAVTAKQ
jgi:hypothetical protein